MDTYGMTGNLVELNSHPGQRWTSSCYAGRTELEDRRGGKAQKSNGHNQSSADKEACNPVFPPIRPGKADYSIPGLFLACSLSLSLSFSFHCGRRTRSVIFRDVRSCYLTCSFQRLWRVGHYCNCVTFLFTSQWPHIWLELTVIHSTHSIIFHLLCWLSWMWSRGGIVFTCVERPEMPKDNLLIIWSGSKCGSDLPSLCMHSHAPLPLYVKQIVPFCTLRRALLCCQSRVTPAFTKIVHT